MTQNHSNSVDEGAARKNPPAPEYAESWERIFGKKEDKNEENKK